MKNRPLLREIEKLPISESGMVTEGVCFLRLQDGTHLVGFPPNQKTRTLHGFLSRSAKHRIRPECIGLAKDVVCRYAYPHADASAAPPYSLRK